jgi:hypothetical protein
VQGHGQRIDGKNMMHCMRLIQMSKEIGRGEGIIVRDQMLLSYKIRRGEVNSLIAIAEQELIEMDKIFDESDLPRRVEPNLVNDLLVKIQRVLSFILKNKLLEDRNLILSSAFQISNE